MAENQGTHVPGEEESSSLSPQIVEQAREEKARKKGWKPLEEYDGPAEDWVDAKEFLGREPLFEANRDLKRQIKQQQAMFERDMKVISSQFAQMNEQAYKRALADLQEQRDVAIIDKDLAAVKVLDSKIDETKQAHIQSVQKVTQQQQVPAETDYMKQWREKNDWFDKDTDLRDEAVSIGVGHMASHPGVSQEKMLEYVEDRIKKIYPEKFQQTTTRKGKKDSVDTQEEVIGKEDNVVEKSTRRLGVSTGNRAKLTVADLSDQEQSVMRTFIKRGVFRELAAKNKRTEQEEYLAQLAERR